MVIEQNVVKLFAPTERRGHFKIVEDTEILSGMFFFAFIRIKPYPKELSIKAVHQNVEKDIRLKFMPDHFYRAEVPGIGNFYFSSDNPRDVYTEDNVPLSVLTPINEDLFEYACKEHRFFFVG